MPVMLERTCGSSADAWQEESTISLPSLWTSTSPPRQCWLLSFSQQLLSNPTCFGGCSRRQSTARAAHTFPPSALIRAGCSRAAEVLGSNLANNPLPSPLRVVPLNPVITSAKLPLPLGCWVVTLGLPQAAASVLGGSLLSLPWLTCCTCLLPSVLGEPSTHPMAQRWQTWSAGRAAVPGTTALPPSRAMGRGTHRGLEHGPRPAPRMAKRGRR